MLEPLPRVGGACFGIYPTPTGKLDLDPFVVKNVLTFFVEYVIIDIYKGGKKEMEKETRIYSINDFYALKEASWSGALYTLNEIEEKGKEEELIDYLNDIISSYDNGIEETMLNDILWFDCDAIYETLGISQDEE